MAMAAAAAIATEEAAKSRLQRLSLLLKNKTEIVIERKKNCNYLFFEQSASAHRHQVFFETTIIVVLDLVLRRLQTYFSLP